MLIKLGLLNLIKVDKFYEKILWKRIFSKIFTETINIENSMIMYELNFFFLVFVH